MSYSLSPRLPLVAAALCAALALSACGGDHKAPQVTVPPPSGGSGTTPVASDSFFDYVLARVNALIDNEEPASIDSVTETKPENTEPAAVN